MFEKEAEEYIKKDGTETEKLLNSVKLSLTREEATVLIKAIKQSFKNGAEFGYNKCKEELNQNGLALQSDMDKTIEQNIALKKELEKANEWHYPSKGEYPKETGLLMSKTLFLVTKMKGSDCLSLALGEYNFSTQEFSYQHIVGLTDVIAWKEIVLPKENEVEERKTRRNLQR